MIVHDHVRVVLLRPECCCVDCCLLTKVKTHTLRKIYMYLKRRGGRKAANGYELVAAPTQAFMADIKILPYEDKCDLS